MKTMWVCMLRNFSHVLLCTPMDQSPPGSSGHESLQARMPDGLPRLPSAGGSFWPRNQTPVSYVSSYVSWMKPYKMANTAEKFEQGEGGMSLF